MRMVRSRSSPFRFSRRLFSRISCFSIAFSLSFFAKGLGLSSQYAPYINGQIPTTRLPPAADSGSEPVASRPAVPQDLLPIHAEAILHSLLFYFTKFSLQAEHTIYQVNLSMGNQKRCPEISGHLFSKTQQLPARFAVRLNQQPGPPQTPFWSRPAFSRSWFHITWKAAPHRHPRGGAQVKRAADSISLASTPRRFQASHFCWSS